MYTRLQKLGLSISHKSAMRRIENMGVNFNAQALEWRDKLSLCLRPKPVAQSEDRQEFPEDPVPHNMTVDKTAKVMIVVGDNLDTRVAPRDMRIDHQVKSLHYFHSYAALNRVEIALSAFKAMEPQCDISSLSASTFLPSALDCEQLRANYIILAARVIVNNIPFFQPLQSCVPEHIHHKFSEQMKQKSVTVSTTAKIFSFTSALHDHSQKVPLGVIPENENSKEGILKIMEELHKLVPKSDKEGKLYVHSICHAVGLYYSTCIC